MEKIQYSVHYYLISRLLTLMASLYLVYIHILQQDHGFQEDFKDHTSWLQPGHVTTPPAHKTPECCTGLVDVLWTNWGTQFLTVQGILRSDADPDQILTVIICCMITRNSLDLGFTFALKYWADKKNLRGLGVWMALQVGLFVLFGFPETTRLPVLLRGSYAWATSLSVVAAICIGTWFEGMAYANVGFYLKDQAGEKQKQQSKLRLLEHVDQ